MGEEVDKIYVQLKQYESEIKQSNRKLEDMFQSNVNYYHELVKYILAGEQGCRELEEYIAHLRRRPWGSDPLRYRGHGLDVSVSYLAASDGGVTAWEPPEDGPYSISGNNVDGFIITRWARGW